MIASIYSAAGKRYKPAYGMLETLYETGADRRAQDLAEQFKDGIEVPEWAKDKSESDSGDKV